ncbi:hypothetical protein ACTXGQ_15560 [Marinobacter sp. 1Y8]
MRKRRLLDGPVLFPVKGPEHAQPEDVRLEAFEEARNSLAGEGIEVVLYTEQEKIIDFAAH